MRDLIEQCRTGFGLAPRSFSFWNHSYLGPPVPPWLVHDKTDPIWSVYRHEKDLLRDGQIVWGRIIQANRQLYERKLGDSPAEALYSLDPFFDDRLDLLDKIARNLYSLKGTSPDDPEMAAFAASITNEMTRTFGGAIPRSLTEDRIVFHSSILVHRLHLPNRYLAAGFFPLLVDPQKPGLAMILPSRFWASRLLELWSLIESGGGA